MRLCKGRQPVNLTEEKKDCEDLSSCIVSVCSFYFFDVRASNPRAETDRNPVGQADFGPPSTDSGVP